MAMLVSDSLTHSLPNCCLVNLIDVTLACEDANSKLVVAVNIASEVVTVADVDAEDHVGNNLLIWELAFGHKVKLLFRLYLSTRVGQDFEVEVQDVEAGVCSAFCR